MTASPTRNNNHHWPMPSHNQAWIRIQLPNRVLATESILPQVKLVYNSTITLGAATKRLSPHHTTNQALITVVVQDYLLTLKLRIKTHSSSEPLSSRVTISLVLKRPPHPVFLTLSREIHLRSHIWDWQLILLIQSRNLLLKNRSLELLKMLLIRQTCRCFKQHKSSKATFTVNNNQLAPHQGTNHLLVSDFIELLLLSSSLSMGNSNKIPMRTTSIVV